MESLELFDFNEMITCFIIAGREDLIEQLEVLIDQVKKIQEEDDEISDDDTEESIEVGTTDDGFLFLK